MLSTTRIDTLLRTAVLVCAGMILYTGPASAISAMYQTDDDLFGSAAGSDIVMWVLAVWIFAIPLLLAHRWWHERSNRSAAALGIFVVLMLLVWIVFRTFGVWLMGLALAAPAFIWNKDSVNIEPIFYVAVALSALVAFVVPLTALAFQIVGRETRTSEKY